MSSYIQARIRGARRRRRAHLTRAAVIAAIYFGALLLLALYVSGVRI